MRVAPSGPVGPTLRSFVTRDSVTIGSRNARDYTAHRIGKLSPDPSDLTFVVRDGGKANQRQ